MDELSIVRTRFTVPFRIKGTYSDAAAALSADGSLWEPAAAREDKYIEQDLFESIIDLIADGPDTDFNIGRRFRYKPPENGAVLKCIYNSPAGDRLEFDISDAGLYIFKSNIGFLWYEVIFGNIDSDLLTMFINDFKELSKKRLAEPDERRNGKTPFLYIDENNRWQGLLMGKWINNTALKDIKDRIAYFSNRKPDNKTIVADKAVIFNYAVCPAEGPDCTVERYSAFIYRSTNGFKLYFKTPSDFSDMCFKTVEHAICYMTTNGCTYFGIYDDNSEHFFLQRMKEKIMKDYYTMFILVLHQYYGILNFNLRINSACPFYTVDKNGSGNESKFLDMLEHLSSEINIFVTKSFFPSVSHIYHQNEFYYYLQERISIKRNYENLTIGLDSMRKMQTGYIRQREEELEKEENARRLKSDEETNFAFSLLSAIMIVSAITDGDSAINIFAEYWGWSGKAVTGIRAVALVILVIVSVGVIIAMVRSARAIISFKSHKDKK